MCLNLCACGKSEAVKDAEAAINAIGTVSVDSGDALKNAEKLYGILTDGEKAKVENRLTLVDAQEDFEKLRSELAYDNAQKAYTMLKKAAEICVAGMDSIYNAWYFGIYKADDVYDSLLYYYMSQEVADFTQSELQEAAELLGLSASTVKSDWQYSLYVVEAALSMRGDYTTITTNMEQTELVLQTLTEEYDDYTYYPKLKEYYSAVSSYVDFFTKPSGSFQQLADTINSYENNIRTLESDVGFLFH